jgi:hypothetical protein
MEREGWGWGGKRERERERESGGQGRQFAEIGALRQFLTVYVCITCVDYISIHGSSEGSIHGRTEDLVHALQSLSKLRVRMKERRGQVGGKKVGGRDKGLKRL